MSPRLISEAEMAVRLGVSRGTLRNWRSKGRGPAFVKLDGNAVRYPESEIDRVINESRRPRSSPSPSAMVLA